MHRMHRVATFFPESAVRLPSHGDAFLLVDRFPSTEKNTAQQFAVPGDDNPFIGGGTRGGIAGKINEKGIDFLRRAVLANAPPRGERPVSGAPAIPLPSAPAPHPPRMGTPCCGDIAPNRNASPDNSPALKRWVSPPDKPTKSPQGRKNRPLLIRLLAKPGALNGEAWFGVPRLRGANRLKAELRTLLATNRTGMVSSLRRLGSRRLFRAGGFFPVSGIRFSAKGGCAVRWRLPMCAAGGKTAPRSDPAALSDGCAARWRGCAIRWRGCSAPWNDCAVRWSRPLARKSASLRTKEASRGTLASFCGALQPRQRIAQ